MPSSAALSVRFGRDLGIHLCFPVRCVFGDQISDEQHDITDPFSDWVPLAHLRLA